MPCHFATLLAAVPSHELPPLLGVSSLMALITLTALEIVLGIDNVVFIAILSNALPESKRSLARRVGLLIAMFTRVALLWAIKWLTGLTATLFEIPLFDDPRSPTDAPFPLAISGRDLVLLTGGLFLIAKATWEIRHQAIHHQTGKQATVKRAVFGFVVAQIVLVDLVFSLDSVITAVGMAEHIQIMIAAVIIAILIMMASAGAISRFIETHPSMKVLALSFLVMIGVMLVADGLHHHIDRGYVYFAMAFALVVDLIQMRLEPAPSSPGSPPNQG